MELIKAQKGTQDLLPEETERWRAVEDKLRQEAELHGFGEIRTPVFEDTRLFQRSVGETTDVVQKEMYTFTDKGERSLTLKPEGTAGTVRAYLEHGLSSGPMPARLYYITPCYRYENTQKGRQREFHQFGVELFGSSLPQADAEVISLAHGLFGRLGVRGLRLEINSIGCPDCRAEYTRALTAYFRKFEDKLCGDCLSRLDRNPMRVLDCKKPGCAEAAKGAPKMLDYLCDDCRAHFERVKEYLDAAGIEYTVNPTIVRGLDYYTRTVFEFVSTDLGAQSTVCGGGRYDGLVEEMGGKPTPALGFALGLERLMLILRAQKVAFPEPEPCALFVASLGDAAQKEAFRLVHGLRKSSVICACDLLGRSLKAQMKYADRIGARFTMVLGDEEIEKRRAALRDMKTGKTEPIALDENFADAFISLATQVEDDISF